MDLLDIKNEILKKVKFIEKIQADIKQRGEDKAVTLADYEKQIAITNLFS